MQSLKMMSFNIDGSDENPMETRKWHKRRPFCVDILRLSNADLIGLQEVQSHNRAEIDTQLVQYASEYGVRTVYDISEKAFYNPIYWKSDRFEKISSGSFYLSKTPTAWSKAWDAMHVRAANWVKLQCKKSGYIFMYMNVHLDHHGSRSRLESSKLIISETRKLTNDFHIPIIISGDFNTRAWAPSDEGLRIYPPPVVQKYLPEGGIVYHLYTDENFKDAYIEAGNMNQLSMNTYHDYNGDNFPPVALRIDWILMRDGEQKFRTKNYARVDYASPPIYPSDHFPLIVDLILC